MRRKTLKAPKLREPKEKEIQKQILDFLHYHGVFCWKHNSTGIYKKATGQYIPVGMRGVSDILGILKGGIFLAIEVKARLGKVSYEQQRFIDNINEHMGIAFVARSVDDVLDNIKDFYL